MSIFKKRSKRLDTNWCDKYIQIPKAIYTTPPSLDTDMLKDISQVSDTEMYLRVSHIRWIEAIFAIGVIVLLFMPLVYTPIHDYNRRIDVFREYIETGKSTASYQEQERYLSASKMDYYEGHGLNGIRETSFYDSNMLLFLLAGLPLYIAMLYWFYISTKHCRDILIFNRKKGTIYYRYNYGFQELEVPVDDVIFQPLMSSFLSRNSAYLGLRLPHVKGTIALSSARVYTSISFFIWFMDRNRPLPPGTAFDSYRQIDYRTRSKNHFPEPLYESGIPTPELNSLVQEYRDRNASIRAKRRYNPELQSLAVSFENK